jgi:peptidoglycan/LPS O-acetylase OafA/YrhL
VTFSALAQPRSIARLSDATARPAGTYPVLDVLRWTSAWLVLAGHLRAVLFVDYSALSSEERMPAAALFYFLTGLGHQAVVVFFVISGFLVGGGIHRRFRAGTFSFPSYAIDRAARIHIVLIPALLISAAVAFLLSNVTPSSKILSDPSWSSLQIVGFEQEMSARVFICNVLGLQTLVCPTYALNSPLWSLAQEWFYYLTAPLLWGAFFWRGTKRTAAITIALAVCVGVLGLNAQFLSGYLLWLLGAWAGIAAGSLGRDQSRVLQGVAFGAFCVVLIWSRFGELGWASELALAAALATWLALSAAGARPPGEAISKALSGYSYSLYVVHYPLIIGIVAAMQATDVLTARMGPTLYALGLFAGLAALLLLSAWAFSRATEQRTDAVRRYLQGLLLSKGARVAEMPVRQ